MKCAPALFLLLAGCTEVDKTVVVAAPPPLPDELPGQYSADFRPTHGGPAMATAAEIAADVVNFVSYPCFVLSGQQSVGGQFLYDLDGHFQAELKTLGGEERLRLDGFFSSDGSFAGAYDVRFLDTLCEEGEARLRRVQ